MNWGKGIFISFVLFAVFMAVMVTIMMRQSIGLVSTQYYKDDLAYQEQYIRKQNTEELEQKPEITIVQNQYLKVVFPVRGNVVEGDVKLYRPSEDKLDQNFKLRASSDSIQLFQIKPLEHGAYRAKMKWKMNDKEYYLEKVIVQ